jgi:hypothetical protein
MATELTTRKDHDMTDFEQTSIEEQARIRNCFLARMTEISELPDAGLRARVHVAAFCYCAAHALGYLVF